MFNYDGMYFFRFKIIIIYRHNEYNVLYNFIFSLSIYVFAYTHTNLRDIMILVNTYAYT